MRRTALIALAVAGGLIALVVIAVAIAVATVDVHTLLGPLQARIKSDTGRDLVFAGPVDLKLSLQPTLVASDVRLSNAPWGRAPQMLRAQRIDLQVALLPLLQRRFELTELALIEPQIALETDAKGRGNWELATPAASPAPPSAGEAAGLGAFALANMSIQNGSLAFHNGATGKTTQVAIERFAVHTGSGNSPVAAELKGKVGDVALALTGTLGSLDALRTGQSPYPIAIKGEIDGKPAALTARIARAESTTTLDPFDLSWGTLAAKGQVRVIASGTRTKYVFSLTAPTWSPADAAVVTGAALGVSGPKGALSSSHYLFSDQALPLDALKAIDAEGDLSIATLVLDERTRLQAVKLKLALKSGRLDIPALQANGLGGTLQGRLAIDAARSGAPGLSLKLDGRDLDLAAILAVAGAPRQIKGGKTTVAVDVASRGASLHQWAASATGQVMANIGATTLVNTKVDLESVLDKLMQAVNPFRDRDPSTELICAVVRLPLADGIAKIDRSIAIETKKIGVSASGTLDFREEKLDLAFHPKVRQGIPLDIPQFAQLVRFSGPFAHPAISIDAAGSALTIAKIGAAIGTSGLSILGSSIVSGVVDSGSLCVAAQRPTSKK